MERTGSCILLHCKCTQNVGVQVTVSLVDFECIDPNYKKSKVVLYNDFKLSTAKERQVKRRAKITANPAV